MLLAREPCFNQRLKRFQQFGLSSQHLATRQTYAEQFGLFLDDEKKSNVRIILDERRYSATTREGTDTLASDSISSTITAVESFPNSVVHGEGIQKPSEELKNATRSIHLDGYRILTSAREVKGLFARPWQGMLALHVGQQHSYARLSITRHMFEQILEDADVFEALKDSILHTGYRTMEFEVCPPRPRLHFLADAVAPELRVQGLEVSYGIRHVACKREATNTSWVLRQSVVYNKTIHARDNSLWIFFSLPDTVRLQIEQYVKAAGDDTVLRPFEIHALILANVISMWRPYLIWLSEQIEQYRMQTFMAEPNGHGSYKITDELSQIVQDLEHDIINATLAVEATRDLIETLQVAHQRVAHLAEGESAAAHTIDTSFIQLAYSERLRDINILAQQLHALRAKTNNVFMMASNLLTLENGYSMKDLSSQARLDGIEMANLTKVAGQDARAGKALAVIAMVYLPITVVLNFFSASFIDTSDGTLRLVGQWWFFLVVGLPLTFITLLGWLIWTRRTLHGRGTSDICETATSEV